MNTLKYFNKTVRGHLHKVRDIPCEDYSGTYGDDKGRFYIAAVADGHGDKACFRSSFGSRIAVEIAIDDLKDFAEAALHEDPQAIFPLLEKLKYPKGVQMLLRRLTDSIISKWYEAVHADLANNPPTEDEYIAIGEKAEAYKAGKHLEHIYGTTLIAALWMEDYLLLIQQGDGRCDVFYDDGHIDQPIPWDSRCHENVTTSMCDPDVDMSIRHCVIDLKKKGVVACFLGSDGVEDSFPDPDENQAGTHYFFKQLSVKTGEMDKASIEQYLDNTLPGFSQHGSGDDVSVAGLIDPCAIQPLLSEYKKAVWEYETRARIAAIETKITSMDRKHKVLRRKYAEAQEERKQYEEAEENCKDRITRLSEELKTIKQQREIASSEKQKKDISALKLRSFLVALEHSATYSALIYGFFPDCFFVFNDKINTVTKSKVKEYEFLCGKAKTKSGELTAKKQELQTIQSKRSAVEARLLQAKEAFEAYDAEYQFLCGEKQKLLDEIEANQT